MTTRYRRVPQSEGGQEGDNSGDDKRREDRIEYITEKVHSAFWVGISIFIVWYTDLIDKALFSDELDRFSLNIAVLCFVTSTSLMLWATVYLPYTQNPPIPIHLYSPNLVPVATALGLFCLIFSILALWPLYGLLAPIMVLVLTFGVLMSTHFLPWPAC